MSDIVFNSQLKSGGIASTMKSQSIQNRGVLSIGVAVALALIVPTLDGNCAPKPTVITTPSPNNRAQPATPPPALPSTTTDRQPLVAVPVLTPATLKNFTTIFGQVMEVKFTPERQRQIQRRLSREWMTNLAMRNTVTQTIALEPQLVTATPADRTQIQAQLVANLRQQVLDGDTDALWLVSFYDAKSKNWLAPGKPPLTRMTTDISADALCFMINEIMGKSVVTPDAQLKNAIATKLTAEYPKVTVTTKQVLSDLPANWVRFKQDDWYRRSDEFREQMRIHWGQNLEAYIPELRPMNKLRHDRLAKLKADPQISWYKLNSLQRQAALQQSDVDFQNSVRTLPQVKVLALQTYVAKMQVASAIGNSPTRYALGVKK